MKQNVDIWTITGQPDELLAVLDSSDIAFDIWNDDEDCFSSPNGLILMYLPKPYLDTGRKEWFLDIGIKEIEEALEKTRKFERAMDNVHEVFTDFQTAKQLANMIGLTYDKRISKEFKNELT